jgi:hypothetical protein
VTGRRRKRRRKVLDDLKERKGYSNLKEEALDRTMWRVRFGRGFGPETGAPLPNHNPQSAAANREAQSKKLEDQFNLKIVYLGLYAYPVHIDPQWEPEGVNRIFTLPRVP